MSDKFVVSTNEIGEIIVTDVETGNVYRYGAIHNFLGLIRLLNEQQVKLEIFEKILPKQLPVECQKCKFFVAYRNFNYEKMTNDTITIYCDLLQNKETYDRDTGDEIWENGWLNECPLRKGGFYE